MKPTKIKNYVSKVVSQAKDAYSVAKNADAKTLSNPNYTNQPGGKPGVIDALGSMNRAEKNYGNMAARVGEGAANEQVERERGFYESAVNRARDSAAENKAKKGK